MFYEQTNDFTGGRNTDDDLKSLPQGDFLYAYNCHIGITNQGHEGSVENVKGNTLVSFSLPAGINKCIGKCVDSQIKAIVFFLYNSNGDHSIRRFFVDTNAVEMIMQDPVLGFRPERRNRIHSSNIVEEKLYWVNLALFPCKINMDRAIGYLNRWFFFDNFFVAGGFVGFTSTGLVNPTAPPFIVGQTITIVQDIGFVNPSYNGFGTITGVSGNTITTDIPWALVSPVNGGYIVDSEAYSVINQQTIDALKYPPNFAPKHIYLTDDTKNTSNLRSYLYQVSYRYIYDDFEKSAWSSYSKLSLPQGDEGYDGGVLGKINQNNVLRIALETGPNLVKKIEVAVRIGNNNDFFNVVALDKAELGIEDNVAYNYDYYNTSNKIGIEQADIRRPFDNLPQIARSQELLSENVIAYGGTTEGYDNVNVDILLTPGTEILPNQNIAKTKLTITVTTQGISPVLQITKWILPLQYSIGDVFTLLFTVWDTSTETGFSYRANHIVVQGDTNASIYADIYQQLANQVPSPASPFLIILSTNSVSFNVTAHPTGRIAVAEWSKQSPIKKYPGFKTGASHGFGIVYKDRGARSGTVNDQRKSPVSEVYVPMPTEQNAILTNAYRNNIAWEISNQPPSWATHYSWYYTGNKNVISSTEYIISDITRNVALNKVAIHLDWLNTHSIMVPGSRVSPYAYDAQNKDRIRFLTSGEDNPSYPIGLGQLLTQPLEFEILGVDSLDPNIIYVQDFPFEGMSPKIEKYSLVEIFTPKKDIPENDKFFFEFAEEYEIGNPGTPQAYHKGQTASQGQIIPPTSIPYSGASVSGGYFTLPGHYENDLIALGTFVVVGGANAGTYTVISASPFGSNSTIVYVAEPITSIFATGNITFGSNTPLPSAKGVFRNGDIYHIPRILFTEDFFYTLLVAGFPTNATATVVGNVVDVYNSLVNPISYIIYVRPDGSIVPLDLDTANMPPTYDATTNVTTVPVLFVSNPLIATLTAGTGTVVLNAQGGYAQSYVETFSYSDFYESNFYDKGRPNIVDIDTRRKYLNIVRHSRKYLQETKINGLNTFYDESVQFSDNFGVINKIIEVGYTLKVLQEQKNTSVYIGRTVTNLPDGSNQVLGTNTILGTTIPQIENYGTVHPESVLKHDRYLYYYDFIGGSRYIRDAANGPEVISDYKMKKYFRDKAVDINQIGLDNVHVFSEWDETFQKLLVTFWFTNSIFETLISETIAFHESKNRWRETYGYYPEEFGQFGQTLISFKNGLIWVHNNNPVYNNFYGVQKDQKIRFAMNTEKEKHKVMGSIAVYSTEKWFADTNFILVPPHAEYPGGMRSRIVPDKFVHKQGCWYADFSRDANTPNANPQTVYVNGRKLQGYVLDVMLKNDKTTFVLLDQIIIQSVPSEKSK